MSQNFGTFFLSCEVDTSWSRASAYSESVDMYETNAFGFAVQGCKAANINTYPLHQENMKRTCYHTS